MEKNKRYISFLTYTLMIIIIAMGSFYIYQKLIKNPKNISNNNGDQNHPSYQVNFISNGSDLDTKEMECTYVNNDDCYVIMPKFERDKGKSLGYSLNPTDKEPLYKIGDKVKLTSNITLYAISYQTITLTINGQLDYLKPTSNTCNIYNTDSFCNIIVPYYNKLGYETRGYSTNKNSLTGFIYPGADYKLTKDVTLYPIYNTLSRYKTIDIKETHNINNMIIEIEKNCNYDDYKVYLDYFKRINEKASYLVVGSKITLLNNNTFNYIWGEKYVGMNYGPRDLRLIDIRCSNSNNNYYATIIHEMAHTWDFYYTTKLGSDITEQSDVINLYNKYQSSKSQPFRSYSYSNIREFFADMVRYYYLKYKDPDNYYKSLVYPEDIKNVLEKYICIANNNYQENKCK